jgi:hypothetical protein
MSIESNLLTTVQEVYFDLVDLQNNNYLKGIKIEGFDLEEFKNMRDFIDEQISKLNYLENHMKTLFDLEDQNG